MLPVCTRADARINVLVISNPITGVAASWPVDLPTCYNAVVNMRACWAGDGCSVSLALGPEITRSDRAKYTMLTPSCTFTYDNAASVLITSSTCEQCRALCGNVNVLQAQYDYAYVNDCKAVACTNGPKYDSPATQFAAGMCTCVDGNGDESMPGVQLCSACQTYCIDNGYVSSRCNSG
jgi:hypothetical protein